MAIQGNYQEINSPALTNWQLTWSFFLIVFILVSFSLVFFVACIGHIQPEYTMLTSLLRHKISSLKGWPMLVIAYLYFIWGLLWLSNMGYDLIRPGGKIFNMLYFLMLYGLAVSIFMAWTELVIRVIL